jgi:hypothetical protein
MSTPSPISVVIFLRDAGGNGREWTISFHSHPSDVFSFEHLYYLQVLQGFLVKAEDTPA